MDNYNPSKENQIIRWQNISHNFQEPSTLKCFVCDFQDNTSNFKSYTDEGIFNFGTIKRFQCPNCDVIFGDLKFLSLTYDEISKDYADTYSYFTERTQNQFFIHLFKYLPYFKPQYKIIDYGCGSILNYQTTLNRLGYNIDRYDKFVKDDSMIKNIVPQSYDILFNHNVIEHVINPIQDLQEMINCVKPNGLLIISSACWNFCIRQTHFHTFFFIGRSVNYLCQKLNIQLIDTFTIPSSDNDEVIKVFKKL